MKKEKVTKLIPGNMNIPYVKCKAGYADGANKRQVLAYRPEQEVKAAVIKLRKNEGLLV